MRRWQLFIFRANVVLCFQCENHPYPGHFMQQLGISTFFLCINKINLGCESVSVSKPSDSFPKWRSHQVQNRLQFPIGIICALRAELESVGRCMDSCQFHINRRVRKKTFATKNLLQNFPFWCIALCHINIHGQLVRDTSQFLCFNAWWHLDVTTTCKKYWWWK